MAGYNETISDFKASKIYKATIKAKSIIIADKEANYFSNYLNERNLEVKDLKLTSEQRDKLQKLI